MCMGTAQTNRCFFAAHSSNFNKLAIVLPILSVRRDKQKEKVISGFFWIVLFVFNNLGPVQTPITRRWGRMEVGVSACPQYGNRIRDWVPLFQRSYLEMGIRYSVQITKHMRLTACKDAPTQ